MKCPLCGRKIADPCHEGERIPPHENYRKTAQCPAGGRRYDSPYGDTIPGGNLPPSLLLASLAAMAMKQFDR